MSGLICRTRGDRSPQGLPKVYLAIHPGDREGYLEEFVGLLLELQSMSVWYPEDPEMVRTEEVMDDLARMSLFVVPVTTRLLTAPDPVLTEELRFARQKHIPVLPVVVEQGLEELYERRFGDLQFLDRNAKDETVMSFRQKLERYLSSVLIGDQLTKRIRDAFGACMFLSYRKKDRKYAQELMRSVHSHEACRDIGIWYDEFLIPGEGFNDAIRAALERSKLFLMAVTPNLVDEDNYVVTEEYPAARKAEKPVLPVELVSTDRAALEEAFEQIPPCVDARDPEGFRRALMAAVDAMEIRKRDRSPEHDYLIGLAYLRGVDVEVDHDRAVELIHGAAEAGLPEAARRLVQMYLTGDGVERDYQQAVRWQEQVVSCCEETHGQDRGLFSHEALTGALLECGHQYMAMERLEEAERMYERARAHCSGFTSPSVRSRLSFCYSCLGEVAEARGDLDRAEDCYRKELDISRKLTEETGIRTDHGFSYLRLGDIAMERGDLDGAEHDYWEALKLQKVLMDKGDRDGAMGRCYGALGDVARARGDLDGAEHYYRKRMELCAAQVDVERTDESQWELAVCYDRLGEVARDRGDLAAAEEYFQKTLEVCAGLAEKTGKLGYRWELERLYGRLGDIALIRTGPDAAEGYFYRSYQIALELMEQTGTVRARRSLVGDLYSLGDVARRRKQRGSAQTYYLKGIEICRGLAEVPGALRDRQNLLSGYNRLGDLAQEYRDLDGAEGYYRQCLDLADGLAEGSERVELRRVPGVICERLGDIAGARLDMDTARAYYRRSLEISMELAEMCQTATCIDDLAHGHFRLVLYDRKGRLAHLREAARLWGLLCERCPEVPGYRTRLRLCRMLLIPFGGMKKGKKPR